MLGTGHFDSLAPYFDQNLDSAVLEVEVTSYKSDRFEVAAVLKSEEVVAGVVIYVEEGDVADVAEVLAVLENDLAVVVEARNSFAE